ncbi:MAG: hypothetical protein ACAI25_02695, partial [Planctomycetota bacterium]
MPALFFLLIVVGGWYAFNEGGDDLRWWLKHGAIGLGILFALRWAILTIQDEIRVSRHRARIDKLQAFANDLEKGALDARGFYSGGVTTVCGKVDGREFQATLRLAGEPFIAYELRAKEAHVELDALAPTTVERLTRAPLAITWTKGAPGGAIREVDGALVHLLVERGFARAGVLNGWVRAEGPLTDSDLQLDRLRDVVRSLGRLARACEPRTRGSTAVYDQRP